MTTISNGVISAVDLSKVVMLNSYQSKTRINTNVLTDEDIQWQEERRRRKVKRLDFEVRRLLERVRLVEDTALKAAGCKNFAGSIPVLSVGVTR